MDAAAADPIVPTSAADRAAGRWRERKQATKTPEISESVPEIAPSEQGKTAAPIRRKGAAMPKGIYPRKPKKDADPPATSGGGQLTKKPRARHGSAPAMGITLRAGGSVVTVSTEGAATVIRIEPAK